MVSATNCRTAQQAAAAAHQIARAATQFGVSEIIVYNSDKPETKEAAAAEIKSAKKVVFDSVEEEKVKEPEETEDRLTDQDQLVGLLEYFVTPSYLRKALFGDKARYFDSIARKLPKLPGLDFLNHEESRYFVGLSVARKVAKERTRTSVSSTGRKRKRKSKVSGTPEDRDASITGYINIGDKKVLKLAKDVKIPVNSIVVVDKESKAVVSPEEAFGNEKKLEALQKKGLETSADYWTTVGFGYKVRKVERFGQVFTECPYAGGYRYSGFAPCSEFLEDPAAAAAAVGEIPLIEEETFLIKGITTTPGDDVPVLLVTGKWKDVERAVLADTENFGGLDKAQAIFDGRVRMGRGSRVEDAVLIALAKIEGL